MAADCCYALPNILYDLTSLLFARVSLLSVSTFRKCWPPKLSASGAGSLNYGKSVANLERDLKYLQRAAFEALIFHGLRSLEEHVQQWHHQQWHRQWQQERQLDFGWFSEWPNGRRPLSTTWPWNIKPSLVVLWGVCWMFYDNSTRTAAELRLQLEDEGIESSVWARHTPRTASSNQRTPEYNTTLPGCQSSHLPLLSPYINSYPVVCPDPVADAPLIWPQNQGSYSQPVPPPNLGNYQLHTFPPAHRHSAPSSLATFSPDYNIWQDPLIHQPRQGQLQPQRPVPNLRRSVPSDSGTRQPYAPFFLQATPQRDTRATGAAAAFSPSLQLPMGHLQNYPSPHSDFSKDETRSPCFSILPGNEMSPIMMPAASPSVENHPSPSSIGRKGEEPPRDASGQMTCNHPKCVSTSPVFARRCEWTKHMDKHTRPYICNLPGCEKVRGFTYSGGLSRHQREVHREYGGPKASYMCPHEDCKRSTGSGFSRRENLQEHLRRVHRQVGEAEVEKLTPTEMTSPATTKPRKRRRRFDDEDDDQAKPILHEPKKRRRNDDNADNENTSEDRNSREDLPVQVKMLRKQLREKDERLKRLEQTVELLTSRLT
ncbi:MAG: hypothetical protein L6R35_003753 [Caloplaca aegaea]|nr:MAG: hypothetical protein L6R35_003753 [Caloplaca aegaea]